MKTTTPQTLDLFSVTRQIKKEPPKTEFINTLSKSKNKLEIYIEDFSKVYELNMKIFPVINNF